MAAWLYARPQVRKRQCAAWVRFRTARAHCPETEGRSMQDRRIARTREALIGAFNHLVLNRRQRHIRVADIVAEANVGRSTFYEHYSSADDILLQALARPM